ncbi:condensation domain-containing protein [Streptomyces sp. NPDC019224]|uniref:condensation domain-containing protein n=1 Tax=Streptomyces sp. NPDC019224 TaxID=3154484 RepID=UPI0033EC7F8D
MTESPDHPAPPRTAPADRVPLGLTAVVEGLPDETAPATWSQQALWHCLQWRGHDAFFNQYGLFPLPERRTGEEAVAALSTLMRDCPTLRTLYDDAGGSLRQTAHGTVRLPVPVHAADETADETAEDTARRLAHAVGRRLRDEPFDSTADWPLRAALVTAGGLPRFLVLAFNRIALDSTAAGLVDARLTALLAGTEPEPPGSRTPVEQARHESSAQGRATATAALAYWDSALERTPTGLFGHPGGDPAEGGRFVQKRLASRAVTAATQHLATRHRVSTSAVLLAATAALLRVRTGHSLLPVQVISANRADSEQADLVATLTQDGLAVLDLRQAATVADVIRAAFTAGTPAYWYAHCDEQARRELIARHTVRRGAPLDLGVYFNDVRGPAAAPDSVGAPEELKALAEETTLSTDGYWDRIDARFFVSVARFDDTTLVMLQADTVYTPEPVVEHFLRAFEKLLLTAAAAEEDVSLESLPVITGLRPDEPVIA